MFSTVNKLRNAEITPSKVTIYKKVVKVWAHCSKHTFSQFDCSSLDPTLTWALVHLVHDSWSESLFFSRKCSYSRTQRETILNRLCWKMPANWPTLSCGIFIPPSLKLQLDRVALELSTKHACWHRMAASWGIHQLCNCTVPPTI